MESNRRKYTRLTRAPSPRAHRARALARTPPTERVRKRGQPATKRRFGDAIEDLDVYNINIWYEGNVSLPWKPFQKDRNAKGPVPTPRKSPHIVCLKKAPPKKHSGFFTHLRPSRHLDRSTKPKAGSQYYFRPPNGEHIDVVFMRLSAELIRHQKEKAANISAESARIIAAEDAIAEAITRALDPEEEAVESQEEAENLTRKKKAEALTREKEVEEIGREDEVGTLADEEEDESIDHEEVAGEEEDMSVDEEKKDEAVTREKEVEGREEEHEPVAEEAEIVTREKEVQDIGREEEVETLTREKEVEDIGRHKEFIAHDAEFVDHEKEGQAVNLEEEAKAGARGGEIEMIRQEELVEVVVRREVVTTVAHVEQADLVRVGEAVASSVEGAPVAYEGNGKVRGFEEEVKVTSAEDQAMAIIWRLRNLSTDDEAEVLRTLFLDCHDLH